MTPTDSQKYAQTLLRLNPCVAAQQIIQRRSRYLGIEHAPRQPAGADRDLPARRHRAEQALGQIRAEFWSLDAPQIESRLAAVNFEGLPDLADSAARLAWTARASADFSRLAAERGANQALVDSLRQIVVLPPAEAGPLKQRLEVIFTGRKALQTAKRTIGLIAKKYPQIYALEDEWLDHVASFRASRSRPAPREAQAGKRSHSWLIWIAIVIAINVLRALMSHK